MAPTPGVLVRLAEMVRVMDPPALVDVAHQIHVRADRLADEPGLLDFARRRRDARQAELHFGLAMPLFPQSAGGGHRLFELQPAPQGAAGVDRDTVAPPPPQPPQ